MSTLCDDRPDHPDRLTCKHAGYIIRVDPLVIACRCTICFRCAKHTGNNTQGHHWSLCQVTGTLRDPHFCCPGNCELETEC